MKRWRQHENPTSECGQSRVVGCFRLALLVPAPALYSTRLEQSGRVLFCPDHRERGPSIGHMTSLIGSLSRAAAQCVQYDGYKKNLSWGSMDGGCVSVPRAAVFSFMGGRDGRTQQRKGCGQADWPTRLGCVDLPVCPGMAEDHGESMIKTASIVVIVICVLIICAVLGALICMVRHEDIDFSNPWQ